AAGAVFRGDLQGVFHALEFGQFAVGGFEGLGCAFQQFSVIGLHADSGVRADEGADAALDAELFVPDRDVDSDVALLVLRGGGREGTVGRHHGDSQVVAEAGDDAAGDVLDEFRGGLGDCRRHLELAGGLGRYLDFVDVLECFVDGGVVHGDNFVAGFAVALLDGAFDLFQGN